MIRRSNLYALRLNVKLERSSTAVPTPGFEIPPYHVESFPGYSSVGWHCVCNKHGFNCLSFTDKPGAKFTTLEDATAICERWNMRSNV